MVLNYHSVVKFTNKTTKKGKIHDEDIVIYTGCPKKGVQMVFDYNLTFFFSMGIRYVFRNSCSNFEASSSFIMSVPFIYSFFNHTD